MASTAIPMKGIGASEQQVVRELHGGAMAGDAGRDEDDMARLGKRQQLKV